MASKLQKQKIAKQLKESKIARRLQVFRKILQSLLLVEMYLLLKQVQTTNLINAKNSPMPKYDFAEVTLLDFRPLGIFLTITSILFWYFMIEMYNLTLERKISTAITTFLASTLGLTAIFASLTKYWVQGFIISLIIQSIAFQFLMLNKLRIDKKIKVNYYSIAYMLKPSRNKIVSLLGFFFYALLTFSTIYYPTMHFQFWDYIGQEGRFAMQNAFIFSEFPLRSFSLLGEKLSYHWGFDGLVAGFATLINIPLDVFNFLFTVILFILACLQIDSLAQRLIPNDKVKSSLVTIVILFGGGIPFYLGTESIAAKFSEFIPAIDWKGIYILPPTISYFFQKSFAISIPIIFLYLRLMLDLKKFESFRQKTFIAGIFLILFTGLAISSATLFITAILSSSIYLAVAIIKLKASRFKFGIALCAFYSVPVIFFSRFAGFADLIFGQGHEQGTSNFHIGLLGTHTTLLYFVVWTIVSIGPFFSVYLYAILKIKEVSPLLQTIGVGFVLYFLVKFQGSVDMIKFMVLPRMLFLLILCFLIITFIDKYVKSFWNILLVGSISLAISVPGLFFLKPLLTESFQSPHVFDGYARTPFGPTAVVAYAKRMEGINGFICSPELINYCGVYGGLTQLNPDGLVKLQNIFPKRQLQQSGLLTNPRSASEYSELGFAYLIVGPDSGNWAKTASEWIATNKARVIFTKDGYSLLQF